MSETPTCRAISGPPHHRRKNESAKGVVPLIFQMFFDVGKAVGRRLMEAVNGSTSTKLRHDAAF
jgi:hypothetical protein